MKGKGENKSAGGARPEQPSPEQPAAEQRGHTAFSSASHQDPSHRAAGHRSRTETPFLPDGDTQRSWNTGDTNAGKVMRTEVAGTTLSQS